MADDRIFIRCRICGEAKTLFKYLGCELWIQNADKVGQWATEHAMFCGDCSHPNLKLPLCFELVTEGDPRAREALEDHS